MLLLLLGYLFFFFSFLFFAWLAFALIIFQSTPLATTLLSRWYRVLTLKYWNEAMNEGTWIWIDWQMGLSQKSLSFHFPLPPERPRRGRNQFDPFAATSPYQPSIAPRVTLGPAFTRTSLQCPDQQPRAGRTLTMAQCPLSNSKTSLDPQLYHIISSSIMHLLP